MMEIPVSVLTTRNLGRDDGNASEFTPPQQRRTCEEVVMMNERDMTLNI